MKSKTGLRIQIGGDIRTLDQIADYLDAGIDRVIIGFMAVKNPNFVKQALERFGSQAFVVGIDAKNVFVATEGRLETSQVDYLSLAKEMEKLGCGFLFTPMWTTMVP